MKKFIIYNLCFISFLFGANEASFLSVKVHYLSEIGKVVLNGDNDKEERVEVLVSILDEDGEIATSSSTGGSLSNITNSNLSSLADAKMLSINDIDREDIGSKNTARFILDYTDVNTSELNDELTINIAGLDKTIEILFSYSKAKGLIVRTSSRDIDPTKFQGQYFENIEADGENNLAIHARSFYGGTAGLTVPLKIYASTKVQKKDAIGTTLTEGRFTMSSVLEGAIVVVKALADYDNDGIADIIVAEGETKLYSGIGSLDMKITSALPENDSSLHSNFIKGALDDSSRGLVNGLGIAFIAYMKDDLTISNKGVLKYSDLEDPDEFKIRGNHNATDIISVKSDIASDVRIGDFNKSAKFLDLQWEKIYTNYYVLDDNNADTKQKIILTAVDRFGNPAFTSVESGVHCIYDSQDFFDIQCDDVFVSGTDNTFVNHITITPSTTSSSSDTTSYVNRFVKEGSKVHVELEILGKGGMSALKPLDVNLYMGRVTTNYMSTKGFSSVFSKSDVVLRRDNGIDRDFKVVVRQTGLDIANMKVEVYRKVLNGSYESNNKASTYDPRFDSSDNAISGINMSDGGTIKINDVGDIEIPAYTPTGTTDGLTAYFFAIEDTLDVNIVILAQGYADNSLSSSEIEPGTVLKFYSHGVSSYAGDYMRLQYGTSGEKAHIGLSSNSPISKQSVIYRNIVGDFTHSDGSISIVGYTANSGLNTFSISINGHNIDTTTSTTGRGKVISKSSDMIIDTSKSGGLWPKIEFAYQDTNNSEHTRQINVKEFGARNSSQNDGSSPESLLELNDISGDDADDGSDYFEASTQPIYYKGEILANRYYLLFNQDADIEEQDIFGNVLKADSGSHRKIENYDYDISGRGEIASNSKDEVYIKFDNKDANEDREVTIGAGKGENKIIFTNIVASSLENESYIIRAENTIPQINLVNTEVILKVIGDNRGIAYDFALEFSHSDKEATMSIIRIEDLKESFISDKSTGVYHELDENGNYYILRTDKAGDITIDAQGKELDDNSREVKVETSKVLRFVNFDTDPPIADVSLVGNRVTVTVIDPSLDYDRTKVELQNGDGEFIESATYADGGYVFSGLDKNTVYQIYILAVDLFDNKYENTITRVVGLVLDPVIDTMPKDTNQSIVQENSDIQLLSDKLINNNAYIAHGKFVSYSFGGDSHLDWIFQDQSSNTYQLYGTTSDKDPFGFLKFILDITKINTTQWWMVKLNGNIGEVDESNKFGWVVVSSDLNVVKKLQKINTDGSLSYLTLPIKAKVVGQEISFYK